MSNSGKLHLFRGSVESIIDQPQIIHQVRPTAKAVAITLRWTKKLRKTCLRKYNINVRIYNTTKDGYLNFLIKTFHKCNYLNTQVLITFNILLKFPV